MTTGTTTATRTTDPTAARNPHGAVEAAIVNLVPLWVANHLLEWEWPPFLTPEYDDLLPWIQVSLGATIAANVLWAV